MSMYEETVPVQLLGSPHDGTEVDVRESEEEVQRPTAGGSMARYLRFERRMCGFVGYAEGVTPPQAGDAK